MASNNTFRNLRNTMRSTQQNLPLNPSTLTRLNLDPTNLNYGLGVRVGDNKPAFEIIVSQLEKLVKEIKEDDFLFAHIRNRLVNYINNLIYKLLDRKPFSQHKFKIILKEIGPFPSSHNYGSAHIVHHREFKRIIQQFNQLSYVGGSRTKTKRTCRYRKRR